jgi:signal transduction histidine kinase
MRLRLATRISLVIIGVAVFALATTGIALFVAWRIEALVRRSVVESVPSVRAAAEIEVAWLEQNAAVRAYYLERGNREWLNDLERRKEKFDHWMAEARDSAYTVAEQEILTQLDEIYRDYSKARDQVIASYEPGKPQQSRPYPLRELRAFYGQAHGLCETFLSINLRDVNSAVASARGEAERLTWIVAGSAVLTFACTAGLLWIFFRSVLLPLRKMAGDARRCAGTPQPGPKWAQDELDAVGGYLRALMESVADSRSVVQRSQEQLMQAEKLAAVGNLAASVAHEIRNPLNSIRLWLHAIHKTIGPGSGLDREFEGITGEVVRVERIVRHFLEFSRPPALRLSRQDPAAIIDKTFQLFHHWSEQNNVCLAREADGELPPVLADPEQLQQVLLNLLGNAADATGRGGRISLSTTVQNEATGQPMLVVRVRDTGPGVPAELRDRIFEPFFTTKAGGTGLGLCVSAQIMVGHKGRLVLESSNQRGTTFAFSIPLASVASPDTTHAWLPASAV